MSRLGTLSGQLYRGEVSYDFVGRRRRWYTISIIITVVALASLAFRGLNLGIEFTGGAVFTVPTTTGTVEQARETVADAGVEGQVIVQTVGTGDNQSLRIETEELTAAESAEVTQALAEEFEVSVNDVSTDIVGPSWGEQVTQKAITGLAIFMVLITAFLAITYEWKMAITGVVALIHDLIITIGVYSLLGIEVTPATVIGVLTILGYSLYDTVVVFDGIKENTRNLTSGSRMTYSQAANLSLNQTLVRSINTSIIALLPVAALLFGGALLLGAGTLKDLSLALFVGIIAGTYSSIFIATPLLAQLKEREPAMQALARRVAGRGGGKKATAAKAEPVEEPVEVEPDDIAVEEEPAHRLTMTGPAVRPAGPRQQPKRKPASKRRS